MTDIVLADDHQTVRENVRVLLENEPDLQVVGEAGNGLEAVSTVERLHPDVLLLDLMMPDMSGFEVARTVRKSSPETKIVILTLHANAAYALEALKAGALGYVIKHAGFEELLRAIRAVRDGRRYLCRPLSEEVLDAYRRRTTGDNLSR